MSGLEVIKRGTRWRIGNGRLIHIWENKWLPTPTTYKVISPPFTFDDFPVVSALIDSDTRRWKANLIRSLFLPFEASTILNIPLSYNLPEDKFIWVGNTRGVFTVKSAYYIALKVVESTEEGESSSGDCRTPLWKRMWHLTILVKMRIFSWRTCMNELPTMLNLQRTGVNCCETCPSCGRKAESASHTILRCDIAKKVWEYWIECPVVFQPEPFDIADTTLMILAKGTSQDLEIFFGTTWSI